MESKTPTLDELVNKLPADIREHLKRNELKHRIKLQFLSEYEILLVDKYLQELHKIPEDPKLESSMQIIALPTHNNKLLKNIQLYSNNISSSLIHLQRNINEIDKLSQSIYKKEIQCPNSSTQ